jgi:hypothetical protein
LRHLRAVPTEEAKQFASAYTSKYHMIVTRIRILTLHVRRE